NGIAGAAALPGSERPGVVLPGEGIESRLQVDGGEFRIVEEQVPAELAPAEFAQELVDICRQSRSLGRGKTGRMPDLPWADLAKAQVRRERGGAVAVGTVALACVSLKSVSEEGFEPLLSGCFARIPALAQAASPVGMARLELPVFERLARDARDRRQPLRR